MQPVWSHNGEELFYQDGNKMMSVSINAYRVVLNWLEELKQWAQVK